MKVNHQTGGQHHGKGKKQGAGGGGAWARPWTASCILPTGAAGPRATGRASGGPGQESLDPKTGISLPEEGEDAAGSRATVSGHRVPLEGGAPLEGGVLDGKGAIFPGREDTSLWVAAASPSGGVSLFQIRPGGLQ